MGEEFEDARKTRRQLLNCVLSLQVHRPQILSTQIAELEFVSVLIRTIVEPGSSAVIIEDAQLSRRGIRDKYVYYQHWIL